MKTIWTRISRFFRYFYLRVLRVRTDAHSTALGLALGVFIGCLPIIPFQCLAVLGLAVLFGGNKIVAVLGTFVSNPPTLPIFYFFLYKVGKVFVPGRVPKLDMAQLAFSELLQKGWDLVTVMMVGGLVVGIPAAIITYFIALRCIQTYQKKRELRRLRKFMEQR